MERMRELSGTTQRGTTLLGLYQAANEIGLKAEAYEADLENLQKLEQPSILHIIKNGRLQHYVICYGCEDGEFIISDPAEGLKRYTPERLEKEWQSKALLLLEQDEEFVTTGERRKDRWVWLRRLAREDINILLLALALGIFVSVLSLATAIFSQKLIDEILPAGDTLKLFVGLGLLAFLLFARSGLSWIRQLFLIRQSRDFNNRIINTFYSSLLRLPVPFFFNRKTGDLIARMNDTRRLQRTITFLFSQVMIDVLLILAATLFIMSYSLKLGLFVLLSVPLYFALTWLYHEAILGGQKEVMAAHSLNESNYVDTIQGIATIKTANREPFFSEVTKKIYGFFQDKIFDLGKISIGFTFWADVIGVLFILGVLLWSSLLVLEELLLLGALVAIFQMTSQMIPSANRLALTNIQLQEARVAFERMYEFTSLDPEYDGAEVKKTSSGKSFKHWNSLAVSELSFRFPGRSPLLKNISFDLKRGQMIALLGESGCGKTTLLQILQRFYDPEEGDITINDQFGWYEISTPDWRYKIAVVPQQIKIFNGTLLDNICLGDHPNNLERVVEFCREHGFHEYFEKFPQQYGTLLGEEGANISGGQRQLVAMARALYQKPALLLLDEATASMDRETEQKMLKLLRSLKDKMGIILVTHRVQSAKWADRLYIIQEGLITKKGSPKQLAKSDNLFSRSLEDISLA